MNTTVIFTPEELTAFAAWLLYQHAPYDQPEVKSAMGKVIEAAGEEEND